MRTIRLARTAAAVGLTIAALAGCTSDATEATGTGGGGSPASTDGPITIGFINQENAATGSFPDIRLGAEAAAERINADGGIDGREIELVQCTVDGTPERSQACANQMVEEGVVIAATGYDSNGPAAYPILHDAGIPQSVGLAVQSTDFTGDGVYVFFGGSPGGFASQAAYVAEQDPDASVAILANNSPPGLEGADLLRGSFEAAGVTDVEVFSDSPTATDFTAALTPIKQAEADYLAVVYVAPACGQIMQTARAIGIESELLLHAGCLDAANLEVAGDSKEGALFSSDILPWQVAPDDDEVRIYVESMAEFSGVDEDGLTSFSGVGFAMVMDLARVLETIDGDLDAATVDAALAGLSGVDGFMDDELDCSGEVLPDYPTICNASSRIVTFEGDRMVDAAEDWVNP